MYLPNFNIALRSGDKAIQEKSPEPDYSDKRHIIQDRRPGRAFDDCDYIIRGEMRDPFYFGGISAVHAISHKCLETHFKFLDKQVL